MGLQLKLILTAYFVNSGWALVQSNNPFADQAVTTNTDDAGRIQENIQSLLNSIAKNDIKKSEAYQETVKTEIGKEQQNFNKMKEELWIAQDRNENRRGYLSQRSEAGTRQAIRKRSLADFENVTLDLNYRDEKNRTYMHLAADSENITLVDYLIYHKADLNPIDEDGQTPLHIAAYKGDLAICVQLVYAGADFLVRDKLGRTPLHWAAITGDPGVLNYLIHTGSDIDIKDVNGKIPMDLARNPFTIKYFQDDIERRQFNKVRERQQEMMSFRVREAKERQIKVEEVKRDA